MSTLRILILGDSGVGKSGIRGGERANKRAGAAKERAAKSLSSLVESVTALSVRYLTKRYLGEYMTSTDLLYRCAIQIETELIALEILDSSPNSQPEVRYSSEQQMSWADAIIVMYSIINRDSFHTVRKMLQKIQQVKPTTPVIVLGNKRDLTHQREVSVMDGRMIAEEYGCQFYEISTAESFKGVSLAFESLLREAQALRLCHPKTFPRRTRSSLTSVSKMIGAMFGKTSKKKRPSLSL